MKNMMKSRLEQETIKKGMVRTNFLSSNQLPFAFVINERESLLCICVNLGISC